VFGVAREETARISCEVMANPQTYIYFEWRFNTTGEMVDMPHDRFRYAIDTCNVRNQILLFRP
jgi:hypothetical protein